MQLENGSHLVSGKPGHQGRGVIVRRERKVDEWHLEVSLGGGGYHFDGGIGLVRVGSGKRAEEGSGVFIHCLDCLLESGFWKKNPQLVTCAFVKDPGSKCLSLGSCLFCLLVCVRLPKSSTLEHNTHHLIKFLFVLHQRCGKASCFLKWEFPGQPPRFAPASLPSSPDKDTQCGLADRRWLIIALCIHRHLNERTSSGFRHQMEIQNDEASFLLSPFQINRFPCLLVFFSPSFLFSGHGHLPSFFLFLQLGTTCNSPFHCYPFWSYSQLYHGGNLSRKHSTLQRFTVLKSELIFLKRQE